jgi:hypothetical protein
MAKLDGATSSGEKSASALILTGRGQISAVMLYTDGTNAATLTLYDNTSGSGTKLYVHKVGVTADANEDWGGRVFTIPVKCNAGIYATLTGANATYAVEYLKGLS